MIFTLAITRTILKKVWIDGYKVTEYVLFTIIYLVAIPTYISQADGMFFVLVLVILTIISYINKYGPIFLTSIIAILVNVLILTREFWFSIPWWGYMLGIGVLLISFAIRNELSENKQKNTLKKKLSSIKENVDL